LNTSTLSPGLLLSLVALYFFMLYLVSVFTQKTNSNTMFFTAGRQSPWYVVAFGMIGASLSGVTFISIPGLVGKAQGVNIQFSYMQVVMGYLLGYAFIATVLLPLYYRLNLTSIYGFLQQRFGMKSYKTGAMFFILSRLIGATFRLYLVVMVIDTFVLAPIIDSYQPGADSWLYSASFPLVTLISVGLIWLYTHKGGIQTVVWTDTMQTLAMLIALVFTIYSICDILDINFMASYEAVSNANLGKVFFWGDGWNDPNNFVKQFVGGASIAIVMTGLDQDMMQKNLTCKTLGESQKNMFWFSIMLIIVNFLFLLMGGMLYLYAASIPNFVMPEKSDMLFPVLALQYLPMGIGIAFIIGLIAAAYSSADSAMTALTTAVCVDILGIERGDLKNDTARAEALRKRVHLGVTAIFTLTILVFWFIQNDAVVNSLFTIAGYTYGPLLGLFAFGLLSKRSIDDNLAPLVCILAPVLSYVVNMNSEKLLWGYKFSFELLIFNGILTFLGLWLISRKKPN
jgi:Na+/proline symporter